MLWSIASNAFCKSIRTIPVRTLDSKAFVILSWRYESVEWNFLKPDWNLYVTLFSDKRVIVWSWKIFFIALEISGSREIGLKFFRPKKKNCFQTICLGGLFYLQSLHQTTHLQSLFNHYNHFLCNHSLH